MKSKTWSDRQQRKERLNRQVLAEGEAEVEEMRQPGSLAGAVTRHRRGLRKTSGSTEVEHPQATELLNNQPQGVPWRQVRGPVRCADKEARKHDAWRHKAADASRQFRLVVRTRNAHRGFFSRALRPACDS